MQVDHVTGLLVPTAGALIRLASGEAVAAPHHSFVHPRTGRVLPIAGNVAFDAATSKLVVVADFAEGQW